MRIRSRMTGAALVLALSSFGLAACGSDSSDSNADAKDTSKTDTKTDAAPTDSAPTDAAPTDSAPTDSAPAGDKPSKDNVVKGYTNMVTELMGGTKLPDGIVKKVVTCFVDEVYDDASAKTLNAIADGNQTGVDPADVSLFTDATTTCQKAAMG